MNRSASETVGVLSDTHLRQATPALLAACELHLASCARLLHAGDITEFEVLEALGRRYSVEAVRGNMDFSPSLTHLPKRRIVQVGGLSIGLAHGAGAPGGLCERLLDYFGEDPPPVIIHGHSHVSADVMVHGVRFLNPGSATGPRGDSPPTLGRLTVAGEQVTFEILPL